VGVTSIDQALRRRREDTILDRPRALVIRHSGEYVETLLECPWCAGFWIALAWWGAYELWPHGTTIAAVPFAISAVVGIVATVTSD
jgi:hypothetical protein